MDEDSSVPDGDVALVFEQLRRIFGDGAGGSFVGDFALPVVTVGEAIDFLRTVPAGTGLAQLSELASAYRAVYPVVTSDLGNDDPETARSRSLKLTKLLAPLRLMLPSHNSGEPRMRQSGPRAAAARGRGAMINTLQCGAVWIAVCIRGDIDRLFKSDFVQIAPSAL